MMTALAEVDLESRRFAHGLRLFLRDCHTESFEERTPCPIKDLDRQQSSLLLKLRTQSVRTGHWLSRCAGEHDDACEHCGEPDTAIHAIAKCVGFSAERDRYLPHTVSAPSPEAAPLRYIYLVDFKVQCCEMREKLLRFLQGTGLANRW